MLIHVIAVKPKKYDGEAWIVSAWDEWSIEENPSGYEEDIKKQTEKHKDSEVRIGIIDVSDHFFDKIFSPPIVKGTIKETQQ